MVAEVRTNKIYHLSNMENLKWMNGPDYDDLVSTRYVYAKQHTDSRTVDPDTYWKNWKERIAKNLDATTTLYGVRYSTPREVPGVYQFSWKQKGLGYTHRQTGAHFRVPFDTSSPDYTSLFSSADADALRVFNNKVRKLTRQFQGGIFLGELREALRAIRNPAQSLRRQINDYYDTVVKRGRRSSRSNLKNTLADTWLEYSFGWAPLVNDIQDAAVAFGRYENSDVYDSERLTASSLQQKCYHGTIVYSQDNPALVPLKHLRKKTCSVKVVYRAGVAAEILTHAQMARNLFGFKWNEFVPTVWELIPYSFLVDYFTNIGDVLSAYSLGNFNKRWINRTIIHTVDTEIERTYPDPVYLTYYRDTLKKLDYVTLSPYQVTRRYRSVSRASYSGSIVPSFQFEVPGYGSLKWLNIAGLLKLRTFPTV